MFHVKQKSPAVLTARATRAGWHPYQKGMRKKKKEGRKMKDIERKIQIDSIKEMYDKLYPVKLLVDDPIICVEAFGFLKAIEFFCPLLAEWSRRETSIIKLALNLNCDESEV